MSRRCFEAWAVAALAAAGCGGRPSDPVREALVVLETAAESRDADALGARLTDDFRGKGNLGRAEATATLRRYFAAYQEVRLTLHEVEVAREADGAAARFLVEFSGDPLQVFGQTVFQPTAAVYRFELDLTDAGGLWRVRRAEWEQVTPREP
jgi:hypothetical protein